jgi:hypothetical protein
VRLNKEVDRNVSLLIEKFGRGADVDAALSQFGLAYGDFEREVGGRIDATS